MAVIAGDLVTRLGVDGRKFQSGLSKARGETRSFAADVTKIVSGIAIVDIFKSSASSMFGLASGTVGLAASAETASVQFKVLTGSAESAARVMDQINKFAADTPFESMEITQAAKQLLAFGGDAGTVITELKTLGELSSGMGIPLTELAEIYGKARIQGRLFMEDINQLQGRGINISAELAKEFGNVREAVEKGQVNFGHLERALKAMTSEGGDFAGMMVEMSQTFEGQTSTLIDNVKSIGRGIGEAILPKLTAMVSEANAMLSKFNELPDRIKFIGDVIDASMDVAFLSVKEKWKSMLKDMVADALKIDWMGLINPVEGQAMDALNALMQKKPGEQDMGVAQARLKDLLGQVAPAAPNAAGNGEVANANVPKRFEGDTPAINNLNAVFAEWDRLSAANREAWKSLSEVIERGASDAEIVAAGAAADAAKAALMKHADVTVPAASKAVGQERFTSGIASMFGKLKESPLMGSLASAGAGVGGMVDRAKIQAGAIAGTFSNWLGTDREEQDAATKSGPSYANAMQKGSQEAFSTILNDVLGVRQDPLLKATKEQTKQIVAALTKQKTPVQPKFAPEFA
jgi:hypothetical protein